MSTMIQILGEMLVCCFNSSDIHFFQLNGTTTIKEIASDMIGVEASWRTYKKVDFANEPSIFGFEDEKPDKLFFHLTALVSSIVVPIIRSIFRIGVALDLKYRWQNS